MIPRDSETNFANDYGWVDLVENEETYHGVTHCGGLGQGSDRPIVVHSRKGVEAILDWA